MSLNGGYAMIKYNSTQEELQIAYRSKKPALFYDENQRAHWAVIEETATESVDEETQEPITLYEYSYRLIDEASSVVANPTLSGNEATLNGLDVNGTKYKVGGSGVVTLDDIVDANGNKRFIEGTLKDGSSGATIIYNKWSLSGTHLMIVLTGIVSSNLKDYIALATVMFPTYIISKIKTLGTSAKLVSVAKGIFIKDSEYTATEYTFNLRKEANEFRIIPEKPITINGTYKFRIQFDLLIDSE